MFPRLIGSKNDHQDLGEINKIFILNIIYIVISFIIFLHGLITILLLVYTIKSEGGFFVPPWHKYPGLTLGGFALADLAMNRQIVNIFSITFASFFYIIFKILQIIQAKNKIIKGISIKIKGRFFFPRCITSSCDNNNFSVSL